MKQKYATMLMGEPEQKQSPGRQKMSEGVTTSENVNCENHGGDADDASTFNDADGTKVGLSRRSPMNYETANRDSLGVNNLSRSKYDGSK